MPVFFISCEKMEDTYEEYKGDGKIRYVGKCTGLSIEPGWKRFRLSWVNSLDPTTDKIKITWQADGIKDSVYVSANLTTYLTDAVFENKNYEFSIYAIDQNGNHSLKTNNYARPFTNEHEFIRSFGHVEKKHFFLEDKLIIFWNVPISEMFDRKITYTNKSGEESTIELTDELLIENNGIYEIDDIDLNKDITINRSAEVEGCFDQVIFEPYTLDSNTKIFNSDFTAFLKAYYDVESISDNLINNIETLNINESLISLEDIMHFPNLKKVILGGLRFRHPMYPNDVPSLLNDGPTSIYALNTVNTLKGVEVDIYNDIYQISASIPYAQLFGNPSLPDVNILNDISWSIESSTEEEGYDSHPEYLLDNDQETVWLPLAIESGQRTHELEIDMKSAQDVNGVFIKHPAGFEFLFPYDYFAKLVTLQVSNDGENWTDVYKSRNRNLYQGRGETTMLKFPETHNVRYLKLIVKDQVSSRNNTFLADIVVFN